MIKNVLHVYLTLLKNWVRVSLEGADKERMTPVGHYILRES